MCREAEGQLGPTDRQNDSFGTGPVAPNQVFSFDRRAAEDNGADCVRVVSVSRPTHYEGATLCACS